MASRWDNVGAALGGLISLISVPLIALNIFGGLVSGVWLMILGHWSEIGFGIADLVFGSLILGILTIPSMPLEAAGLALLRSGRGLVAATTILVANAWVYIIILSSCVTVFTWITAKADGNMIPSALWGYANAVGPWGYMASKGGSAETGSFLGVLSAQLGCVSMMVGVVFLGVAPQVAELVPYFLPFAILGFVAQASLTIAVAAASKRLGRNMFA